MSRWVIGLSKIVEGFAGGRVGRGEENRIGRVGWVGWIKMGIGDRDTGQGRGPPNLYWAHGRIIPSL